MRYNVLFIHHDFWVGTTIDADDEDGAIDRASQHLKSAGEESFPPYMVDNAQEILVEEV